MGDRLSRAACASSRGVAWTEVLDDSRVSLGLSYETLSITGGWPYWTG